jgi:hypothetical protein
MPDVVKGSSVMPDVVKGSSVMPDVVKGSSVMPVVVKGSSVTAITRPSLPSKPRLTVTSNNKVLQSLGPNRIKSDNSPKAELRLGSRRKRGLLSLTEYTHHPPEISRRQTPSPVEEIIPSSQPILQPSSDVISSSPRRNPDTFAEELSDGELLELEKPKSQAASVITFTDPVTPKNKDGGPWSREAYDLLGIHRPS